MCFARGPAFLPSGPLHELRGHFPVTMEDDAGVDRIGVEDIYVATSCVTEWDPFRGTKAILHHLCRVGWNKR